MPEVKHVRNICRITDLENHWIAIKIGLALSGKQTRWKGTFEIIIICCLVIRGDNSHYHFTRQWSDFWRHGLDILNLHHKASLLQLRTCFHFFSIPMFFKRERFLLYWNVYNINPKMLLDYVTNKLFFSFFFFFSMDLQFGGCRIVLLGHIRSNSRNNYWILQGLNKYFVVSVFKWWSVQTICSCWNKWHLLSLAMNFQNYIWIQL